MTTIYILIMIVQSSSYGVPATIVAEFNNLQACQSAASIIVRQLPNTTLKDNTVLACAAKGEKK